MSVDQTVHPGEPVAAPPNNHTIRNGIIVAVVFPVLGAAWGIALLVRKRTKEGLIVLAATLALLGLYAGAYLLFLTPESDYSAHNYWMRNKVEDEITARLNDDPSTKGADTSCIAKSDTTLRCLVTFDSTNPQDPSAYEVTIDQEDGRYIITPG